MVREKGRPVPRKARPALPIKKAPPPDDRDPYSAANLVGKCTRCVGKGEVYVMYADGRQRTIDCKPCRGTGLDPAATAPQATVRVPCNNCGGSGHTVTMSLTGKVFNTCNYCHGRGSTNVVVQQPGIYQPSRAASNLPTHLAQAPAQRGTDEDLFDRVMAELDEADPLVTLGDVQHGDQFDRVMAELDGADPITTAGDAQHGARAWKNCDVCGGTGVTETDSIVAELCDECKGTGEIITG